MWRSWWRINSSLSEVSLSRSFPFLHRSLSRSLVFACSRTRSLTHTHSLTQTHTHNRHSAPSCGRLFAGTASQFHIWLYKDSVSLYVFPTPIESFLAISVATLCRCACVPVLLCNWRTDCVLPYVFFLVFVVRMHAYITNTYMHDVMNCVLHIYTLSLSLFHSLDCSLFLSLSRPLSPTHSCHLFPTKVKQFNIALSPNVGTNLFTTTVSSKLCTGKKTSHSSRCWMKFASAIALLQQSICFAPPSAIRLMCVSCVHIYMYIHIHIYIFVCIRRKYKDWYGIVARII